MIVNNQPKATRLWRKASATITGKLHKEQRNKYGQDRVNYWPDFTNSQSACVTMSDGASKALHAYLGAKYTCSAACDWLVEQLGMDENHLWNLTDQELKIQLLDYIRIKLEMARKEVISKQEQMGEGLVTYPPLSAFSATLLFAITDGKRYLVGNLGDGIVGTISDDGSEPVQLLGAENGQVANRTWFCISPEAADHLHLLRGELPSDGPITFVLMTDGSADCLYDHRNHSFAPALAVMAEWLRRADYTDQKISKTIRSTMERLFTSRTLDDCALAFMRGEVQLL